MKKHIKILLLIFLSLFGIKYGIAQLTVDAGDDTTFCTGSNAKAILGKAKITNGIKPFKIAWECKIPKWQNTYYTASNFLNDTTILSPYFKDFPLQTEWIKFKLTVTDSVNNHATDSVRVRFSRFSYLLGYQVIELEKGDSILFNGANIGGGIEPLHFFWQPRVGLINPDSLTTWCKPDSSQKYNIVAIDSCGCISAPNLVYEIRMQPKLNFISENRVWSIVTTGGVEQPWARTFSYKFYGDTTIQEVQYKKLFESEDEQKKNWKLNSLWFEKNDSVFQYSTTTEKKLLVYDFNIAEKDSFLNRFNDSYLYVDSIRTKRWGIGERKLIYFHSKENNLQTVWIKGVGQNGLITRSSEAGVTGGSSCILCFEENGQQIFQNSEYNCCYINSRLFCAENKLWSVVHEFSREHIHPNDPYPFTKTTWYKIGGDTTVNGKDYKHLLVSSDSLKQYWSSNGVLREEAMKVYYFNHNNEMLLYDFDMNINDTISLFKGGLNIKYVLDSIGSYSTEISKLKTFYFSTFTENNLDWKMNEVWIEGIGSVNGLLNESCSFFTPCDDNYELLCFHKDNLLLYLNPNYNDCFIKTDASVSLYKSKNEVDIFPNPATNKIQIQFNQFQDEYYTLDIVSLKGELIRSTCIGNIKTYVVNVNSFSPGVYLLRLKSGKNCYTKKIIVN